MKKWTRWEDWVAVVVGLGVALSTIWMTPMGASMILMGVLGAMLVISGVVNLAMPGLVATEWVQLALGVLLFAAPWVGTYVDASMMLTPAWVSWIGGAVAAIVAALALKPAMQMHDKSIPH